MASASADTRKSTKRMIRLAAARRTSAGRMDASLLITSATNDRRHHDLRLTVTATFDVHASTPVPRVARLPPNFTGADESHS
jgi:hypothetical protein